MEIGKIGSRMRLILLLIIPSTLLVAAVIYVAQYQTVRYLRQTQTEALSGMSHQVSYLIKRQMDDVVLNMLEIEQIVKTEPPASNLLESMTTVNKIRLDLIRGIVFIDRRGVVTGAPETFWNYFSEREQKLIRQQSIEGSSQIVWSDPIRSSIGQMNLFSPVSIISKNVYNDDGTLIGQLAFVIDLTFFLQSSAAFAGNYDTQTLLFDRNNQLIDSLTLGNDSTIPVSSSDDNIQTLPKALKYFDNHQKYYATNKLTRDPGWEIVIVGDVQKLERRYDPVIRFAVMICALGIAGLALIYVIVSWWFTRPIMTLSNGIRSISKGNLDYSFPIDRKDEFGELALEINRMLRRIKQLIYDLRETEEKKRRADFQVLLSQINPHFLYNTLNTIDMLIDFGDKRELHQVMLVLTRLLKYGLDRSTDLRPLREELHNISDYLYILSVRYGNRFTFEVADPGELAEVPVLKLVLQPIVENAVFHGIHPLVDRPGKLAVSVISQGNDIEIRIADNGVGMTPEKMAEIKQLLKEEGTGKGQSIGLFNVHKRIQLYYGMNYGLHIEPGITVGTTVIVKLNILMGMEEKRDVGTNPSADR